MHTPPSRAAGDRLWLIGGTGEGPVLAAALLERGWRVRVSVVSRTAAEAYAIQPGLEVISGSIGGEGAASRPETAITAALEVARLRGDPYRWVIDATHPFATRISAALVSACGRLRQPLLRLQRPDLPIGSGRILGGVAALADHCQPGLRLLLAIGARHLAEAMHHSPEVVHHARILPNAMALQQAMAAGLPPARVACLRPGDDASIEAALCRTWRIDAVLCRRSGSRSESLWHSVCEELNLRLLLLGRPPEPGGVAGLSLEDLLGKLRSPQHPPTLRDRVHGEGDGRTSRQRMEDDPGRSHPSGSGAHHRGQPGTG